MSLEYTPPPLTGQSRLVIIEDGSTRDIDSYHESVEIAREAALLIVKGKGWSFGSKLQKAEFALGMHTGMMVFNRNHKHVGAIYAYDIDPIIRPTKHF